MSRRKITGLWQHPNGIWGIDYRTPDGKRHRPLIGSQELAENELRKRKTEIYEGRYRPQPPAPRMTFSELAAANLESKRPLVAELSYTSDVWRTRIIEKTLGPVLIDQISPRMIDGFLVKLSSSGLSGATCNRYRATLSSAFSYAVRMKLLTENPVKAIPHYPEAECRRRFLGFDEEPVLFAAIRRLHPEREGEAILILHTGIRKGGMFNLLWQDVDLDLRQITVHTKGGRNVIELNSLAVAALRDLHARSAGRAKVCQSTSYCRSADWFKECVEAAGIEDFTMHDLRHTFGSRAVQAGVDLCTVQEWLGHKDIQTTRRRYVHLSADHKRAAIEKLVPAKDSQKDSKKAEAAEVVELKVVNE